MLAISLHTDHIVLNISELHLTCYSPGVVVRVVIAHATLQVKQKTHTEPYKLLGLKLRVSVHEDRNIVNRKICK